MIIIQYYNTLTQHTYRNYSKNKFNYLNNFKTNDCLHTQSGKGKPSRLSTSVITVIHNKVSGIL